MAGLLAGKTCIVTGAASGIGLATATRALRHGARVLGVDITPAPSSLADRKQDWSFFQADLTKPTAPDDVVAEAHRRFGQQIDVLANVAGIVDNFGSVDSLTDDLWDRVIAVNLTAPVRLSRAVIGTMRKQGSGSIINISSKAGTCGASAGVAYTSSKTGLVGATKNMAWRYKDEGIRCNAIAPGGVASGKTGMIDFSKVDQEGWKALEPIFKTHNPKIGDSMPIEAGDIADAIIFLASDMSKKISGTVMPVDKAWCTI